MDIAISALRAAIRHAIAPTINLYRKHAINHSFCKRDNGSLVKEEEIDEFLLSIPYFDKALSYYLIGNGRIGTMNTMLWVNDKWISNFDEKVAFWAASNEWKYGVLPLIHRPGYFGQKHVRQDRILLPCLIEIININ